MFTVPDKFELAEKSLRALNKFKANQQQIQEEEQKSRTIKPINYAKLVFEEYDDDSFKTKVQMDSAYYNVFLNRLSDEYQHNIQETLTNMLITVKSIYETINVKPKVYGIQRLASLNDSQAVIHESATRIINDFISRNYYQANKETLHSKYFESVKNISNDLMLNENIEADNAVEFAIKAVIIDQLLEHINFPMTVKNEIICNLESTEYAQMFDPAILKNMWDQYHVESLGFSKVIASII